MKVRISNSLKWGCLFGAMLMLSCHKDNRTELFTLSHFVDFDIQPGLNTFDTHFFVISPLHSLYAENLHASGKTQADVIGIEAKEAYLYSIFKDVNLKFIRRISVSIFDPFNPSDKIEFFYFDPPYRNTTSMRLFPGIADISHWVEQDFFGVEVRLNFADVTPSLTQMRLDFDIRVLGE